VAVVVVVAVVDVVVVEGTHSACPPPSVFRPNLWWKRRLGPIYGGDGEKRGSREEATIRVANDGSEHPRGMPLVARMQELQAEHA
jgi:hypothetical protein